MKRSIAIVALVLSACRRDPAPQEHARPRDVPSAAPAAPSISAAPTSLSFHVVGDAPDPLRVEQIPGGAFVHAGAFFAEFVDREVRQEPRLALGLPTYGEVARVEGEWPSGAYAVVAITPKATPWTTIEKTYRFYQSRWSPAPFPLHDTPPIALVPWGDRTLSLAKDGGGALAFQLVRGMAPAHPPEIPRGDGCPSRIDPASAKVLGFATGEVLLVGDACDKGARGPAIALRFASGATHPTVDALPSSGCAPHVTKLRGELFGNVVAAGSCGDRPWAARFDGKSWRPIELPDVPEIVDVRPFPRALWIASKSKVFLGETSYREIPRDDRSGEIASLVATAPDEAWVGITSEAGSKLLATRASGPTLHVPDKRTMWEARATTGRPIATAACHDLFAVVVPIGKSGGYLPDDFAFVRELAKGHPEIAGARFVVDDDGTDTTLGAIVPSLDVGDKVLAIFAARVGNAGAKVSCWAPNVIRTIAFDPKTGELVH